MRYVHYLSCQYATHIFKYHESTSSVLPKMLDRTCSLTSSVRLACTPRHWYFHRVVINPFNFFVALLESECRPGTQSFLCASGAVFLWMIWERFWHHPAVGLLLLCKKIWWSYLVLLRRFPLGRCVTNGSGSGFRTIKIFRSLWQRSYVNSQFVCSVFSTLEISYGETALLSSGRQAI